MVNSQNGKRLKIKVPPVRTGRIPKKRVTTQKLFYLAHFSTERATLKSAARARGIKNKLDCLAVRPCIELIRNELHARRVCVRAIEQKQNKEKRRKQT